MKLKEQEVVVDIEQWSQFIQGMQALEECVLQGH